jgi:hypothetical protein
MSLLIKAAPLLAKDVALAFAEMILGLILIPTSQKGHKDRFVSTMTSKLFRRLRRSTDQSKKLTGIVFFGLLELLEPPRPGHHVGSAPRHLGHGHLY